MRSENDDHFSPAELVDFMQEFPKKPKISYSRDQLLSFSELDICKKLPSGFDPSLLSEFGDSSTGLLERSRIPGNLSSQNFRRAEFGSSPPTRGESGSSSRGSHGRWDTRSSGSNDRDADSQLDSESDSGKRYGNQSRRSWQNPEHDGLLGSGSFPKPSGYTSASVTKIRGSGQYQLSRSNEPYHPPRPYKAVPHSRREATDLFNEETFGSSECSNEDRVEEERKRRASFEQFRKEQKTFQEKQKQFPDKQKENDDPDIAALLANCEDAKKHWDKNISSEEMIPSISQGGSSKCSFASQTSASRPLVPPGFTGTVLEKNIGAKYSIPCVALEVKNIGVDENINQIEGNAVANGTSYNQVDKKSGPNVDASEKQYELGTVHIPFTDISKNSVIQASDVAISENSFGVVSPSYRDSNLSEVYGGQGNNEGTDFGAENVSGYEVMGTTSQENSSSLLEKLFGKASKLNSGSSGFTEPGDDKGCHVAIQSKFSNWFLEEEKRPADDLSSGEPKDLLSLIVSGEKDGSQLSRVSDEKPSIFPFKSNELIQKSVASTATSSPIGTIEPLYHGNSPGATRGVLTCEDLEQSILSEISESSSNLQHFVQPHSVSDAKADKRPEIDNHASQHLLSLLQKGTSAKDLSLTPNHEVSEDLHVYEVGTVNCVPNNSSVSNLEKDTNTEKSLTLETLFGTAFMKELQSVKAPVSVQRGSVGRTTANEVLGPQGFTFLDPCTSNKTTLEGDAHISNRIQQSKSNEDPWLGFNARQSKVGSNLGTVGYIENGADEALEIRLPEEESLISVGDPVIPQHSMVMPVENATNAELLSSSSGSVDIVDQLAALNASLQKERSVISGLDGPPFLRGASDPVEPELPYQSQHGRPTSSQFAYPQMNHGRPLFQHLDSLPTHINPHMKFIGLENVIHPEFPQQLSANIFHPSSFQPSPNGPTRFNPPHHPMLQQMHMQGNMLPPHLLPGLHRGAPMPPYPIHHMSGYVPEPNPAQNFPLGHRQPSYSGFEMPMPAHGAGGNKHPEALEMLFEMEQRANLKQMHPVAGAAHGLGTHSHGVDMGFRYR